MKKVSIVSAIIYGICAVFWTLRAMFDVINTPYTATPILLVSEVVCAVCLIVAFIVQLKRCTKSEKEE